MVTVFPYSSRLGLQVITMRLFTLAQSGLPARRMCQYRVRQRSFDILL
jgi:hypothetical protein